MRTIEPLPWPEAEPPALEPGGVHVFRVALDAASAPDHLSPEERDRAARLVTAELRRRWSRARSALRAILAVYARAEPAALVIEPAACVHCGEPHGKPRLPEADWLRFNLSHSAELTVIAVAHGREVGVDVEFARGGRRLERIAARYFDAADAAEVKRGGEAAFYRLWARKEAYLKATAEGLSGELASASLPERQGWELADLELGEAYAGAVAVAPEGFRPTAPAGAGRRSR